MRSYFILLALIAAAVAQTDMASLTGVVSDSSSALVQTATVRVTNEETNVTVSVTTSDKGFYFVPDLRPGLYSVSVTHPGFKLSEQSGIELQVGQTARGDFRLQVGDTAEKVTVTANAS